MHMPPRCEAASAPAGRMDSAARTVYPVPRARDMPALRTHAGHVPRPAGHKQYNNRCVLLPRSRQLRVAVPLDIPPYYITPSQERASLVWGCCRMHLRYPRCPRSTRQGLPRVSTSSQELPHRRNPRPWFPQCP